MPNPVNYVAPPAKVFYELAKQICGHLAAQGDTVYENPEVVNGLSQFLVLIAALEVKNQMEGVIRETKDKVAKKSD